MHVESGVRVDHALRTSVTDVYAAGDCAQGMDLSTGLHDVLAIQPIAVEHKRTAALNMAGRPTEHRGSLNMNVLDTMGLISCSFGLWQGAPGGESAQSVDRDDWRYVRLEFDADRLVGAQAIGHTDHVGALRGLIQTGVRLGAWKERLIEAPERAVEADVAVGRGTHGHATAGPDRASRPPPEGPMRVTLKLNASLGGFLPPNAERNAAAVDAPEGETIAGLLARFNVPQASCHLVLLNGVYQPPQARGDARLRANRASAIARALGGEVRSRGPVRDRREKLGRRVGAGEKLRRRSAPVRSRRHGRAGSRARSCRSMASSACGGGRY